VVGLHTDSIGVERVVIYRLIRPSPPHECATY